MARLLAAQETSAATKAAFMDDDMKQHLSRPCSLPSPAVGHKGVAISCRSDPGTSRLPLSFDDPRNALSFGVDPTTLNAEAQLENAESEAAPLGSLNALRPPSSSFWLVYVITVTYTANFTVVVPTSVDVMDKLGGSKELAGIVVGLYCISGGLMNIPQSRILKTVSLKTFLVVVLFIYVVGNCLSASAEWCGSIYFYILARVVTGAIGGPSIAGTYIARAYDLEMRSSKMVLNASANGVGYAVGPLVSALGGALCNWWDIDSKIFNSDIAGSWIMAVVSLALMFCVCVLFTEPPPFATQAPQAPSEDRKTCRPTCTWLSVPVAVSLVTIGLNSLVISSWETHCQLVAQNEWGWSLMNSALFLAAVNAILVPTTMLGSVAAKRMSDRAALLACSGMQLPCMVLLFNFVHEDNFLGVGLYSLGSALVLCFVQWQRGFLQAIITKQVEASSRQVTLGVFSLVWLFGRGVGAFMGDGIADDTIYTPVLLGLGFLELLIFAIFYKKLALNTNIAR